MLAVVDVLAVVAVVAEHADIGVVAIVWYRLRIFAVVFFVGVARCCCCCCCRCCSSNRRVSDRFFLGVFVGVAAAVASPNSVLPASSQSEWTKGVRLIVVSIGSVGSRSAAVSGAGVPFGAK